MPTPPTAAVPSADAAGGGAAPTVHEVVETVAIDASPDVVWNRVGNFAAMQDWHPAVASSDASAGCKPGSVRTLHLDGGGAIVEELTDYRPDDRSLTYRMTDPGPIPVTNYRSTLSVRDGDRDKSVVEWRGTFCRAEGGDELASGRRDAAAVAAVTGVYQTGLGNLKKLVERR